MRWSRGLGAACAASLALAACGDDTGGGGGGNAVGTGGGGGSASEPFGDGACRACLDTQCAASLDHCRTDVGCASWLDCLLACPTAENGDAEPACEAACAVDGSAAAQRRDAIVTCRRTGAGSTCAACGAEGGGGAAALCTPPASTVQVCGPSDYDHQPCYDCMLEKCCDSEEAFTQPGPTKDLMDCWFACPSDDYACVDGCYAQFPDGIAGFGAYRACYNTNCRSATDVCPPLDDAPCYECQLQSCACELSVCWDDPGCHLLQECIGHCADPACGNACRDRFPEGVAAWDILAVCTVQGCAAQCAF